MERIVMRSLTCGIVVVWLAFGGVASAQQPSTVQDDPVAVAARHTREQKKQQPKAKVWDNDNIPKNPGSLSVVGPSASDTLGARTDSPANAAGGDHQGAGSAAKDSAAPATEKRTAIESNLAAAKEALQNLQNDLDILQRKFALDQQTYYSKPGYSSDKSGASALSDEQDRIDAKQLEMGDAQRKVADLQAQLNSFADTKTASQ
jgi:hypothetical protein